MTDQEITELCARAMGYSKLMPFESHQLGFAAFNRDDNKWVPYNPLQDDAQAMGLVKQLGMSIEYDDEMKTWFASQWSAGDVCIEDDSLNRAICLCAAEIQKQKETQ